MSENTKIEWCNHSWSPWRGCTKVSAGCANCYAETLSKRNPLVLGQWGKGKPRVLAKNWPDPVKWNRREIPSCMCDVKPPERCGCYSAPTVFPSLCDWLDDEVPVEWLARFLGLIYDTPRLNWLLLTKRPENWNDRLEAAALWAHGGPPQEGYWGSCIEEWLGGDVPPNVWIGASVEDQANADRRIPELLKIPAVGRFLSLEPLLGPVDLRLPRVEQIRGILSGTAKSLDWLIIGGESGAGSRPCNVEWIRSLVAQGKAAGVATFVKQLGAKVPCAYCGMPSDCVGAYEQQTTQNPACSECCGHGCEDGHCVPLSHPKGGDPAEWPKDLRVREFPEGLR